MPGGVFMHLFRLYGPRAADLHALASLMDGCMDLIPQLVCILQVHLVQGHDVRPLAIVRVVQLQL